MEDICPRFGRAVTRRRQQTDLSQEAFAGRCGLHRNYSGAIERGERNVSLVNIEKIARAFKVNLTELFRGDLSMVVHLEHPAGNKKT